MMENWERPSITCCRDCKSRSVEPNCHGYCPTYLAQRMELDAHREAARKKDRAALDAEDTRWRSYWRRHRGRRK